MREKKTQKLTWVSTVVLFVRGLAERRGSSNGSVADDAELEVVLAGLEDSGRDWAAVSVAVGPLVARAKRSDAVFLFDGLDVARAARRRARPVGVPLL